MAKYRPSIFSRHYILKLGGLGFLSFLGSQLLSSCGFSPQKEHAPKPETASEDSPMPEQVCDDPKKLAQTYKVKGDRYTARVPDTLDIQDRANLAIQTMTNCADPDNDYATYLDFDLMRNPPIMYRTEFPDGKYMEATALLRHLTGSDVNLHVDQTKRIKFIQEISNYCAHFWFDLSGGRVLSWIGNNYRLENDPCWHELAKLAINRMTSSMVFKDDYCYLPDSNNKMPTGWEATWGGWTLQGLAQLYANIGDQDILELTRKVARYYKDHARILDSEARFIARHPSDYMPHDEERELGREAEYTAPLHFHHSGNTLEGISAYALVANDKEFASFAKKGYEWARSLGSPLVGFFPEYIDVWAEGRPYVVCETCCTVDMILLAMNLTESGQGDYWDDVDRYVRNQFVEMQLLDNNWLKEAVAKLPHTPVGENENGDSVAEKIVGAFSSWASANDWYVDGQPGTTSCCIANGSRALYFVWDRMIKFRNDTLAIHLLFNHVSNWADINSYIPYEGRVDIIMKCGCNLEIRLPEWVQPHEVTCAVNRNKRELSFKGRYALIGFVEPGDLVAFSFPITERAVEEKIGDFHYKLIIKGNDVVSISPAGKWYPFYQREKYRNNQVKWVEKTRFIS